MTVPTSTQSPQTANGKWIVHHDPDWEQFVGPDWLDRIMSESVTDRFHAKQGRSIGRWTLEHEGRTLVVYLKRHFVLPRLHGYLARCFPGRSWSPGLQEWEHLQWAKTCGIPVPRAVAVGEWRGRGGQVQSFLAVEELANMLPLHEAIPLAYARLKPNAFAAWKRGLVAEVARLSRELHRRRAAHQDLYLCHFYISDDDITHTPDDWTGRVVMIDFHRLAHRQLGWQWWQIKDLAQLKFSTVGVAGITPRDVVRFWKRYRAGDWGSVTPPTQRLARVTLWKAARYERHNAKQNRERNG